MQEPLISVVIPTYGRTDVALRAVRSVIAQTHKNLEILVVDDNAKKPEIRKRIEEMISEIADPRVRLIQNEKNLGGAVTRNVGIKASSSDYIAFLDDDDEYLPERIEKQYRRFLESDQENLALVYCHTVMMKDPTEAIEEYRYTYRGRCVFEGMRDCIAATSQWMCKKDALLKVGCFSDVPCKQDSTVIVKLLVAGFTVDYVPEILSLYYRDAGDGISLQGHKKHIDGEEALLRLCREHYDLITPAQQKEVEYAFACRLVRRYRALGMTEKYHEALKRILAHPFRRQSLGTFRRILKKQ